MPERLLTPRLSVSVAYWRFWLCVSVVYELFLIFILFQVSPPDSWFLNARVMRVTGPLGILAAAGAALRSR